MIYYNSYMERQRISPALHERLLSLEAPRRRMQPAWRRFTALAACCVLAVGLWKLVPTYSAVPGQSAASQADAAGSGAQEPSQEDPAEAALPRLDYGSRERMSGDAAGSIALPEGSFFQDLTGEDLAALLGGEDVLDTRLDWKGAEVSADCIFTAEGRPWIVTVSGRRVTGGADDFHAVLTLSPDALPPSCVVSPDDGITRCWGVEVTGRYGGIYGEGANREVWLPESREVEFLAHGVGFRLSIYCQEGERERVEALVSRFVRFAIAEEGVDLSHLTVAPEDVPAWREETFDTLSQAREEEDFAPYLPTAEPEGYGGVFGRLSYQEGRENMLFLRWSRGYDNVEVDVFRDGYHSFHLVSPDRPETYDLSLYPIPWCDSVPEAYRETVNDPAFRAEDMSLALVEARGREHDTGGMTYSFDVLHPDGTLVSYRCDGMTAEEVWALVEETLPSAQQ